MVVTFSFGTAFEGRIYATGNAQACFEMGNRQTQVFLRLPLGATCGTQEEVRKREGEREGREGESGFRGKGGRERGNRQTQMFFTFP